VAAVRFVGEGGCYKKVPQGAVAVFPFWLRNLRHSTIFNSPTPFYLFFSPCKLTKFLTASVGHCEIGLRALHTLVTEFNTPTQGFTLTQHRKVSMLGFFSFLFDEMGVRQCMPEHESQMMSIWQGTYHLNPLMHPSVFYPNFRSKNTNEYRLH
jgi:hypothetical protein